MLHPAGGARTHWRTAVNEYLGTAAASPLTTSHRREEQVAPELNPARRQYAHCPRDEAGGKPAGITSDRCSEGGQEGVSLGLTGNRGLKA